MKTYTVVSGDCLSLIARDHGVTLGELLCVNPHLTEAGRNPNLIYPGEKITIPEPQFQIYSDLVNGVQGCSLLSEFWVELQHEVFYPDDYGQIEPASDVPFLIIFGDGSQKESRLDGMGFKRFDGIPQGPVSVEYEKDVEAEIKDLHVQLKAELDQILETERAQSKAIEDKLAAKGIFATAWAYTKAVSAGAWEGTKDLALFVYGALERNPMINPIGAPLKWKQDLEKAHELSEQLLRIPKEDIEAIHILIQDVDTYAILTDFAWDYIAAQHSLEMSEVAGTAVPEVVIAVLTAGIGTAASGGSKLRHFGKLRGLWKKLLEALRRRRFRRRKRGGNNKRHKTQNTPPKGASRTTPSWKKGGKPRGERAPETGSQKRKHKRENESADTLADAGYDVNQGPHVKPNGKEPDYKIEGAYFDCLSPDTDNIDQVRKGISRKVNSEQADRIVLNMR